MDSFNKFTDSKPYKGFAHLAIGNYEIRSLRFVRNKYYTPENEHSLKRILIAELDDQILFLPRNITTTFDDDDNKVASANNDGIKRFLCFSGRWTDTSCV